ncbi:MAG: hypothetical protein KL787_04215 [Taibaiella sp.]|nr:hypothetical protein [Taibaiella sp.]
MITYTWSVDATAADNLCYQYFYDERGRMVEKKVPGKARELMVYDKRDRMVLSKDGNLASGEWLYTFYDGLNRPSWQGKLTGESSSRTTIQTSVNATGSTTATQWLHYVRNYSLDNPYPVSTVTNTVPFIYHYYDDYTRTESSLGFDADPFGTGTLPVTVQLRPRGFNNRFRPTGSKIAVFKPSGTTGVPDWLYTTTYYDTKGRILQSRSTNIAGGKETSSTIYYFNGMPWKTINQHTHPGALAQDGATDVLTEITIEDKYTRDIALTGGDGAVSQHTRRFNGGMEYDYARHSYNQFGQPVLSVFPPFNASYSYNRRGWLTSITYQEPTYAGPSEHFFSERLYYDRGFNTQYYNGNIAGITWTNYHDGTALYYKDHAYGYTYDNFNRLTHAEYRYNTVTGGTPSWVKTALDYTVSDISYDANGNLLTMKQRGVTPGGTIDMDQLSYTYTAKSNKLVKVEDAVAPSATPMLPDFKNNASLTTEYTYDANGNLKTDANKGISNISYSLHNKPTLVEVTGEGSISYIYDALGTRLRKTVSPASGPVVDL